MEESARRKKHKNKATHCCKHRLLSIQYVVAHNVEPLLATLPNHLPILLNERCGTLYGYKYMQDSCCFKSTDGHVWNFSLTRLNLNVVQHAVDHGGCIILDASASKVMPDSFSRTIPIWAAVLNRIVVQYRSEMELLPNEPWGETCHLPEMSVPQREREQINEFIASRVKSLYESRAIVDPAWLVRIFGTPKTRTAGMDFGGDNYPILCVSCSDVNHSSPNFLYSPGDADDEESWSHRLTLRLFWENIERISGLDEDQTEYVNLCSPQRSLSKVTKKIHSTGLVSLTWQ